MAVTALYAAVIAVILIVLSGRVIKLRRQARIALGDDGDPQLRRAVRAQGNFAEYAPFAIVLLGIAESLAVPALALHPIGVALVTGRIIHAYGVSQEPEMYSLRVNGMVLTFAAIGSAAFLALLGAIAHWVR